MNQIITNDFSGVRENINLDNCDEINEMNANSCKI